MNTKLCLASTLTFNRYLWDFLNQVVNLCRVNNAIAILSTSSRDVVNAIYEVKKQFRDIPIILISYEKKLPNWYNVPDRVWDIVYGRNLTRRKAIELKCDYIFYIDSDVFVEHDLPTKMVNVMKEFKLNVLFHVVPFNTHEALFSSALFMVDELANKKLFFGCYQDIVDENNIAVEDDILIFKAGILNLRVATCSLSDVKHKEWIHRKRNELIFLDPKVRVISRVKLL